MHSSASSTSALDTKSRLPPPPTRTIAPGAPLPPARRAAVASDESDDSGVDDDDPKAKAADAMPDTSRSSRKAPSFPDELLNADNVSVPAHHGFVATAGRVLVVATHGHVRAFDLATGEQQWVHDSRTLGLGGKELRPTALGLQSSSVAWVGTKEGHLIALDLAGGGALGSRLSVHAHAVSHILRHGHSMVTLDDTGKALVFDDGALAGPAPPRVVRIADKQDFAQLFAGKLWTSARESGAGAGGANGAGSTARGPLVRVYDVFVPGSAGRSLLPPEHIGAVTAGTLLPSAPGQVFLGHEGGFVSVWAVDAGQGVPACTEVMRVSVSDVLGLVGVHDRLWAGGRKGTIAAYDVSHKPWMMTNMWNAHAGLPVQRIAVDPYSIDALGKLVVYSIGRDERVRFWDGMLGADWVVQELLKRERSFSTFRSLNILIVSWNTPYTVIHTESLVGLFTCIFVKNAERVSLRHVALATIKRGMGGRYGNKGGIVARMTVDDSSLCFINCHLAAGQHHVRQRNGDIAAILEEKAVFPENDAEESLAYVGGGDGSMVLDHELVFVNGDMNYRIDQRREAVVAAVKAGDYRSLLGHDQLLKEMKLNRGFRLRAFHEGSLTFAPTYKYDRRTTEYDSSEKRRVPAWCDRVLWRAQDEQRVAQLHYQRYEADVSDHRPISAGFRVTVKSVRHDARAAAKADVERVWVEHQRHLLAVVKEFYVHEQVVVV
ncbi:DNase I-like protein [Dentipellis sp. KUC8613]|nr:DNase I-like protein [Dentipellis sp. KUC8613]